MQSQPHADTLVTTKFQLAIPLAVQQASLTLAALHASRARLIQYPDPVSETLASSHCKRCGCFLLDGTGNIRSMRANKRKCITTPLSIRDPRMLRKTCGTCGHSEQIFLEESNATMFQSVAKRQRKAPELPAIASTPVVEEASTSMLTSKGPTPQMPSTIRLPSVPARSTPPQERVSIVPSRSLSRISSRSSSETPSSTTEPPRTKSRSKKKGGLQEMLARNRERQEQEKKKQTSSGLSVFLEGL